MALEYVQIHNINEEMVTVHRHLYLTGDRSRVVEEGDPAGRWLWASPGQRVSRREAVRLGAIATEPHPQPTGAGPDDGPSQPEPGDGEEKQAPAPANKQRRPSANKTKQ